MTLTEEGKALLQLCLGQKQLEGKFLGQISGKERSSVNLTIIGPTSAISSRFINDCKHLYEKYTFLNLNFCTDDHSDLIEQVRKGKSDLAVVDPSLVPNEMTSKMLKPDRYLLVCSSKWKGRRLLDIVSNERIIDFYESDQSTLNYLKYFELDSSKFTKRIFVNNNAALIRLFDAEVGYGTLTESIAKPHIESGDLIALNQGRIYEVPLALTWYPRPAKQQYFEELIKSIK